MIISLNRQWTSGEFWRAVVVLVETIKAETPDVEECFIERAVLRDWLTMSEAVGRA